MNDRAPESPERTGERPGAGSGEPPLDEDGANLLKQLAVGTLVDGKYRIDDVLGRGAMGVVVAATHVHLKERVALKFLHARTRTTADDFHSRFQREAQMSAKLRNEHVTRVIDVGVWQDRYPFMVMDHLSGSDLRKVIKSGTAVPIAMAIDYIVQVCEGMAEAHSLGIVHRDLKPSNLFITKRPDGSDLIKILDFGISKWSNEEAELDELTQTGVVLGSPKYMAPEQLFGSSTVDMRADVWSIGAMFYELLTGRPPFDFPTLTRICAELASERMPPSIREKNPDVPDSLEAVVYRCFARDREYRVQSVAELAGSVLDAIEAPFAPAVRQKIQSILDPKGARETLAASGNMAFGTGTFGTMTGSYGSHSSSVRPPTVSGTGSSRPSAMPSLAPAAPEAKGRGMIIAVVALAVIALVAIVFALRSKDTPAVASAPSASTAAPAPPPPVTAETAAAVAPATAAATESSKPVAAHPQAPVRVRPGVRPPVAAPAPAPSPVAPVVTAAPPASAPAPPPEAPKKKVNPLEDRQ